jgi:hypothetical protein
MIGPIRQPQDYHRFADARNLLGIDNAADVLSSFAFVFVGILGLVFLLRSRSSERLHAYLVLFAATALAGAGSVYYHLAPDDARLVWDRIPIALAVMSLVAAVVGERISASAGEKLLVPLLVVGAASVVYWALFDDLRLYGLVQFGGLAAVLVLALLLPSRYTKGETIFVAGALYGLAKVCELQDREIYRLTGEIISGHTLKHLLAAVALYVLLWALQHRNVRQEQLAI